MAKRKHGQRTPYQLRVAAENLEKNAWQANKVFELLRQGHTPNRIQRRLKITPKKFREHVATLRGGIREPKKWFPEKGAINWSPGKAKRIKRFIDFAVQQIQERKLASEAQKRVKSGLPSKTHNRIMGNLRANPWGTNTGKAREIGVSPEAVEIRRKVLEARGKIPVTDPGERARLAARMKIKPSGVLNKEKRQEILAEKKNREDIRKKAFDVYRRAQDAFDSDNVLPENIADELSKRLDLRLQTFKPGEMPGPEETKLERHFNFHLKRIGKDMERTALERYRRKKEAEKTIKRENGRKTRGITEELELGVDQLDEICQMLRLRQEEKAVAYGVVLGWTDKRIGTAIGYSQEGVLSIRHRIGKALERLKRKWKR